MRDCAVARKKRDYRSFAMTIAGNADHIRSAALPPKTISFEGGNFTTRDHLHPIDDGICVVNRFWDYPADKVLDDFDYLTNASKEYCKKLEAKVPNFHKLSMLDFLKEEIGDDRKFSDVMSNKTSADVLKPILKPNMRLHEAAKCLLGGVECDIASCQMRGCIGPDGVIKYGEDRRNCRE